VRLAIDLSLYRLSAELSAEMLFIPSPLRYDFDMAKRARPASGSRIYPIISGQERLAIWETARGIWKKRAADPVQELKKMRESWSKKGSSLN
jgi:hypothetical protein